MDVSAHRLQFKMVGLGPNILLGIIRSEGGIRQFLTSDDFFFILLNSVIISAADISLSRGTYHSQIS